MGRYGAEEEGSSEAPLGSFGTAKLGHSVARSWAIAWLCDCLGPGGGVHGGVRGAGVCTCLTDWAAAWALALLLTKRCTGTSEDVW